MTDLSNDTTIALMKAAQDVSANAKNKAKNAKQLEKISETAKEFEAMFISEMMKPMFEGISTEAPFGGGRGEEIFRGMMLQEYGKIIAETGGIGIADSVRNELIRMQGTQDGIQQGTTSDE